MRYAPAKYNICIVSADYRLAPQTRLPEILSDCTSAIEFLRADEFAKATEDRVDIAKLFVSGSCAGGWLALMAGTGIGYQASRQHPPRAVHAVMAMYPITDLLDPFWTTKHRQNPGRIIKRSEMKTFLDPNSEKTSCSDPTSKRSMFYDYMIQE
jgi:acetyl esterase/lipase